MVKRNDVFAKLNARELRHNWFQYLSMIAIITLAVTLFCGFVSNTKVLKNRVDKLIQETNLCDLCVQTSGLDAADRSRFSTDKNTEYRLYTEGSLVGRTAKIYVGNNDISRPVILKGEEGVLLDKMTAGTINVGVGDVITLKIPSLNVDKHFTVTGLMRFAEIANTYSTYPVVLTTQAFKDAFGFSPEPLYNQILIKTDDATALKKEITDYFAAKTVDNLLYVFDRSTIESVVMLDNEVSQSLSMISVFPVIFLCVAVLVIMTTISQLILRERTNIGTLKALGFSDGKIMFHYSLFGIAVCFIGTLLGIFLGPAIVPSVMNIKYDLVYNLPKTEIYLIDPLWSLFAVLSVCLLSAAISLWVLKDVIRQKPAECMRPATGGVMFGFKKDKKNEKESV